MSEATSNHWDAWQASRGSSPLLYVDWGDHPTILQHVFQTVFGSPDIDFFQYFKNSHPDFAEKSVLSLCCGDGGFEKALLERQIFAHITGLDISESRIQAALASRGKYADQLDFVVGDVNAANFGLNAFDIVFAKAALHHVENLEGLMRGITQCLRPGGLLVTIDFFGPSRFQWTDAQLAATNWFLKERVPPALRLRRDGTTYEAAVRPTLASMIAMDPSEAVRSGELDTILRAHFDFCVDLPLGGTLLNLIFYGDVTNNFDAENPAHNRLIEEAFQYERKLINEGCLGSDFRLLIGLLKV
jgi:SAM-dependent methyltransferase